MENGSTNTAKTEMPDNTLVNALSESYKNYSILEDSFIPKAHEVNDGNIEANKISSAM